MASPPELWVLVGGNGAGKSTFYDLFIQPEGIPFVNADRIAYELFGPSTDVNSYVAARLAEKQRDTLLAQQATFCFETVFSHESKVDFLQQAYRAGYRVKLFLIHIDPEELNVIRVLQRVSEGGHSVPQEKIRSRIPRTLNHVAKALAWCHEVYLFDNSSRDNPYQRVASCWEGQWTCEVLPLPGWAQRLVLSPT